MENNEIDLLEARNAIFRLFESVRENFDNSEYMQGKKDGLRIALAMLGFAGQQSILENQRENES